MKNRAKQENRLVRFLRESAGVSGCWVWPLWKDKEGYGRAKDADGKTVIAPREAYRLGVGPIPSGLFVLHRCDNPPCVRPSHLFVGTQKDNAQDAIKKGRFVRGSRNGGSKITEAQAVAIRVDRRTQMEIAAAYGISQSNVSLIKLGKHWGHAA